MVATYPHAVAFFEGYIASEREDAGPLHDWQFNGGHPLVDDDHANVHGSYFRISAASADYVRGIWSRPTDHYIPCKGDAMWAWRSFIRGYHPFRMDYGALGVAHPDRTAPGAPPFEAYEQARFARRDTLRFSDQRQLTDLTLEVSLSSAGYVLANPGKAYPYFSRRRWTRLSLWTRKHRKTDVGERRCLFAKITGHKVGKEDCMILHTWMLFLHITGAIVWIGAGVALFFLALRARGSSDPAVVRSFVGTLGYIGPRVFTPSVVVVLVTGIVMALDGSGWQFSQPWILIGLALFLCVFVIGGAFLSRIAAGLDRATKEMHGDLVEASSQISRWLAGYGTVLILLVLAVWDMVFKPFT